MVLNFKSKSQKNTLSLVKSEGRQFGSVIQITRQNVDKTERDSLL